MLKLILPATLLIAVSPALAQAPQQQSQQASAAKPKPEGERLICQDIMETGSRVAQHRICKTAEQWRQGERDAKDAVNQSQLQTYRPD